MIIYPGAFNMGTGKMLWELETKARQVHDILFSVLAFVLSIASGNLE